MNTIRLSPADNVITAVEKLEPATQVEQIVTIDPIPRGHKIATVAITKGEPVLKYAQLIGYAKEDIAPGSHVHVHNMEFRDVGQQYEFSTNLHPVESVETSDTFMGFRRSTGRVGTRNFIAILSSVNCSATACHMIAEHFTPERIKDYPNVDGVVAFSHGTGCGMASSGDGFDALQRVMWGYARSPNIGGVLMAGLGCEINQIDWLVEASGLTSGPLFQNMNIQGMGGLQNTIDEGICMVEKMLPLVNEAQREPCHVSELMIALQCGGSDAWSGMTANPALGFACDHLIARGGTCVLAETPEVYGAEHLLTARAENRAVGEKLINLIEWWKDYTAKNNGSMNNNPSPGNKRGGLTTILEKSLGAVAKGGTTPLKAVYRYAEPVTEKGFVFMDSPGYDPASITGQIASGCNIVVFTTGRGSAFGSKPAPTIKLCSNTETYDRQSGDMDINAGQILSDHKSIEEIGVEIYETMLRVASGEKTKSETLGVGNYEFVPWQIGAVM